MKKKPKRSVMKSLRLTKEEEDMAAKDADKLGLSISAYVRMLIHREHNK